MTERPTSVTFFGWFFRLGGIVGMVFALPFALWGQELLGEHWADSLHRVSPTVLFLYTFLSSLLGLLIGNGILKGKAGARTLALAYCVFAMLVAAVFYKKTELFWANLVGNLLFTAVLGFYLFLPKASGFFRAGRVGGGP